MLVTHESRLRISTDCPTVVDLEAITLLQTDLQASTIILKLSLSFVQHALGEIKPCQLLNSPPVVQGQIDAGACLIQESLRTEQCKKCTAQIFSSACSVQEQIRTS